LACSASACDGDGTAVAPPDELLIEDSELVSQFQAQYAGLDEVVTFAFYRDKTGLLHKRAYRADGSRVRLADLVVADIEAYNARYGRMPRALHEKLDERAPDAAVRIAVVFDAALDENAFLQAQQRVSDEQQEEIRALREGEPPHEKNGPSEAELAVDALVREAVTRRSHEVAATLSRDGFAVEIISTDTPILMVETTTTGARSLARHASVAFLLDGEPGETEEYQAPNGLAFHKVSSVMNAPPHNLDGQLSNGTPIPVGLVEDARVGIHDAHSAFNFAAATVYSTTPKTCTTVADCPGLGGDTAAVCNTPRGGGTKRCTDPHLSQVASQIWSAKVDGTLKPFGAARAKPFVYNTNSASAQVRCEVSPMTLAYDWFTSTTRNVKTTVESWGCGSDSVDGFVQDYNARLKNVFIVKAAPNDQSTNTRGGCRPANTVCVSGLQDHPTLGYINVESYENPFNDWGTFRLDREEPDVVAHSERNVVIALSDNASWDKNDGTSFAAPIVAGMATLVKEKCNNANLDARYLRAVFLVGSWYYSTDTINGYAFSTQPRPGSGIDPMLPGYLNPPSFGWDYDDGAGGPTGDNLLSWCSSAPSGITTFGGTVTISTDPASSNPPFSSPGHSGGSYNLVEDGEESGLEPLSYDDTNLAVAFEQTFNFGGPTRFRAAITWDKCTPTSGPGIGPYQLMNVREDIDLLLCPWNGSAYGTCVAQSRSVFDNKEGFDVTVQNAGTYKLVAIVDEDASLGCNGSYGVLLGYAGAYGTPVNFVEAP
jgi:hypothetical protein